MPRTSLTSSDSVRLRIQRSETSRAMHMGGVFLTVLAIAVARRIVGGAVMAVDILYYPALAILTLAAAYEAALFFTLRRALRHSRLVPAWLAYLSGGVEIAVPISLLTLSVMFSPRGNYAALSGPVILLFPMITVLSVLRLRPRFTLWTGLTAALFHWLLCAFVIYSDDVPRSLVPVLLSYGLLLALIGVAGSVVTAAARRHVIEAVEEAVRHEQDKLRLDRIQRDLTVARDIQASLLPAKPPDFPGFDIVGFNRPADQTGGDYYDWQELPDGRLLVAMADVTGHGIGPALVTALCRAYSRASASTITQSVPLLNQLNNLVLADLGGSRFITLALAMLHKDGSAELLSAGHGPTLLFHASDRTIESFGGDGLPLGVNPGEHYGPSRSLTLRPDDILVLITDGFFEYSNRTNQQFGLPRLEAALRDAASLPAKQIADRFLQSVLAHAGSAPQLDDLTVVVIKRTLGTAPA